MQRDRAITRTAQRRAAHEKVLPVFVLGKKSRWVMETEAFNNNSQRKQ